MLRFNFERVLLKAMLWTIRLSGQIRHICSYFVDFYKWWGIIWSGLWILMASFLINVIFIWIKNFDWFFIYLYIPWKIKLTLSVFLDENREKVPCQTMYIFKSIGDRINNLELNKSLYTLNFFIWFLINSNVYFSELK
jgi:hypothetical protein